MKVAFFDTHHFETEFYKNHEFNFFTVKLSAQTAKLAEGCQAVCIFVNDTVNRETLELLRHYGVKLIALRCAGFNNVDIASAKELGLKVVYVPEYSPHAVAEHAVALIMTLNRHTHRAYNRVKEGNFSLDNLVGFDLYQKKVGIIGVGKIGKVFAQIMRGFGCEVFCYDQITDEKWANENGCSYVSLEKLLKSCDIISLHTPLTKDTFHLINQERLAQMKNGVMLINTGRGALIDTKALIDNLKSEKIGYAGLDVYELEKDYFFQDHSYHVLSDDILARLLTFPNVLLTGHQGFLTREALTKIAETTLKNIDAFAQNKSLSNEVK